MKNNERDEMMNRERKKSFTISRLQYVAVSRYKKLPLTGITYEGCPEGIETF
jgi:hypothetical protein